MPASSITVSRKQVLDFRRAVGHLDSRLSPGRRSLRRIAWAGLQDSMPRAAVLSIHARMESTDAASWEDDTFVQVWGPRYSVYVIPRRDLAVFTLGRLPERDAAYRRAVDLADGLRRLLESGAMRLGEAGKALGVHPNSLRYAAPTGTLLLRWDGARQPTIWTVDPPAVEPAAARKELVRRFLHIYGPSTAEAFSQWAGVPRRDAAQRFEELRRSLTAVETPIGPAWILSRDVEALTSPPPRAQGVRLLPSGDAYYLLQGRQRELLVPEAERRDQLWTSRVWPGAILIDGNVAGTWRRSKDRLTVEPWSRLSRRLRAELEVEARALPLPDPVTTIEWAE